MPLVSTDANARLALRPARHGVSTKYVDERPAGVRRLATPQMTAYPLGESRGGGKSMAKAQNKTRETDGDVGAFLAAIDPPERRADAAALVAMMEAASGMPPRLWGTSILGFGSYHYRYESGREGDAPRIGFSPRKAEFALYLNGVAGDAPFDRLGRHRRGKGCLYVRRLADIDRAVLAAIIGRRALTIWRPPIRTERRGRQAMARLRHCGRRAAPIGEGATGSISCHRD
jgi:hypothetical protein